MNGDAAAYRGGSKLFLVQHSGQELQQGAAECDWPNKPQAVLVLESEEEGAELYLRKKEGGEGEENGMLDPKATEGGYKVQHYVP